MGINQLQLPSTQPFMTDLNLASSLSQLGQTYKQAQKDATRDDILKTANFDGSPSSLRELGSKLVQAGDVQSATTLANLAHQMSTDDLDRTYKLGMLGLEKTKAEKDAPVLTTIGTSDGRKTQAIVNPNKGTVQAIGLPMGEENKLTSVDKKAVFDAEDANAQLSSTRDTLNRAIELAPKAFSGYTAGVRGSVGTNLPGVASMIGIDPEAAKATTELDQLMSSEAIKNMSATLKGASTDMEMAKFQSIIANPNAPPDLKIRTIKRMLSLTDRQAQINDLRIKDLRGGNYFKPGGGGPAGGAQSAPQAASAAPSQYAKGQRAQDAKGNMIEFDGSAWVPAK